MYAAMPYFDAMPAALMLMILRSPLLARLHDARLLPEGFDIREPASFAVSCFLHAFALFSLFFAV